MTSENNNKPVVLVFSGHDPIGGAGLHADIETISCAGCHTVAVITALTAQNTREVRHVIPQNADNFQEQIDLVLSDISVNACKIGLVSDISITEQIEFTLKKINKIPVVLDPVITASTRQSMNDQQLQKILCEKLIPLATLITPNSNEARMLTGQNSLDLAAVDLLKLGCDAVLITGGDEGTGEIVNTLNRNNQNPVYYSWERLPGNFHGSGCTLSACIAALLAKGESLEAAVKNAQEYTWKTLKYGLSLGSKQVHPNRFFTITGQD